MDTQGVLAFLQVAEHLSFSKAAERLFVSQPAVSKRIAALEAELATPLFDRVGRQIRLTAAGTALLPYAQRIKAELEDGQRALQSLHLSVRGRLTLATSHHIGLHRLPPVLMQFSQRYPAVELDLDFMDSEVACQRVLSGHVELAIVTLPTQPITQLEQRLIWPDPLVVVAAPQHPLTQGKPQLKHLANYPAVLPDEATYTHRIVKQALSRHGLIPKVRLATNYLETLKMLVTIGLGWSVLPASMLDDSLVAIPIPQLALSRELGAVWHARRTRSAAATALLNLLPQP